RAARAAAGRGRRGPQPRGRHDARRGASGRGRGPARRPGVRGDGGRGLARDARAAPRARRARDRHPCRPPRGGPAGARRRAAGARARRGGRRATRSAPRRAGSRRGRGGGARDRLALPRRRGVRRAGGSARGLRALAGPGVTIEDRTPGAKPAGAPSGPASTGETFTGDITLLLSGFTVPRPAAIEVADPVVSTVRLFPEPGGTTVTVFVRQPVTYSVSRPSALGEIRIEVRTKTRP